MIMYPVIKKFLSKLIKAEKGHVLILVMIFMLVGVLILPTLLDYMSSGLKIGTRYQQDTNELYAADAGIQDGIWQVKYNNINNFTSPVVYNPYDYINSWSYSTNGSLNDEAVNVSIANVWVPSNLPAPSASEASSKIQAAKLVVTGGLSETSTYQIKIQYYKGASDNPLQIQTLGIWLPPGFTYDARTSNLESDQLAPYYPLSVTPSEWDGGQAVIWTFQPNTLFAAFPGVEASKIPMVGAVTFKFHSEQAGAVPNAVPWITTSAVPDISFAWNADVKIYHITSMAGATKVDTYVAKNELRQMQSAIAGDYYATGNSNLSAPVNSIYRTVWHNPSSATVGTANIPAEADVQAAYLYWSGWKKDDSAAPVPPLNPDPCNNFNNWIAGSAWDSTSHSGKFTGFTYSGRTGANLTLRTGLDLTPYSSGQVTLSWNQSTSGVLTGLDGLDFTFSSDGGSTWCGNIQAFRGSNPPASFSYPLPARYYTSANFKIRLTIVGFAASGQKCMIDNIKLTAMLPDSSVVFTIDGRQVYLDENGQPHQGALELTAGKTQVVENFKNGTTPHGFSYSSFRDVTALVRKYSQAPGPPAANWPGYGTYSVDRIYADPSPNEEWAYACWSLVIIYTSPQTLGHQLYLYDKFTYSDMDKNVDFDGDGQPGGNITGFIVPAPVNGVAGITVTGQGSGYSSAPAVVVSGGGGTGASAVATVAGGKVSGIRVVTEGSGYTGPPVVTLSGGGGAGATAVALLDVNAGKMTAFVGEGDLGYSDDYIAFNDTKLWDGTNTTGNSKGNPNNVFNSMSLGLDMFEGIDVDTLGIYPEHGQYITWASNLLKPGDTSAHIDMFTHTDSWNLIYIIFSFRSVTTTGGPLSYLIQ
jgi:hypothetical protein